MAADNEALWVVVVRHWLDSTPTAIYLFRTRAAARKYRADKMKHKRNKHRRYTVRRAQWGPEQ